MPNVILFRSPHPPSNTENDDKDPYESILLTHGYTSTSIPVLTERLIVNDLISLIDTGGDQGGWSGLIVTSRRAAEAWIEASKWVEKIRRARKDATELGMTGKDELRSSGWDWSKTPLFSPGESSRQVFASMGNSNLCPDLTPHQPASSAASLAPVIFNHHDSNQHPSSSSSPLKHSFLSGPRRQRYLFLTGDKTLRDLPTALSNAGIDIFEMKVYEARPREDLSTLLHQGWSSLNEDVTAVQDRDHQRESREKTKVGWLPWVVFFSPSSAKAVLDLDEGLMRIKIGKGRLRVAAIGKTTSRFLQDQGILVDAVAEVPTPEGLVMAMDRA